MTDTNEPQSAHSGHFFTRRRILQSLSVLILLIIVADLGLRYGAGLGNPVIYETDAACSYIPAANQDLRRFGSTNFINDFNQRSAMLPAKKESGHLRILFIGDSVTYGTTYVDQSDIFTARLADTLPKQFHKPVDVMNASAGGWAVGNEVGYLKSRGTFDADLVIFVLNTGDLIQPFNHVGDFSIASSTPGHKPFSALSELWIRYLWPRISRRALPHDAGSRAAADEPTTGVRQILGLLDEARALCSAANARMAIVYSPCAGDRWEAAPYPESFEALQQWTQDHDIPMLDLKASYAQASAGEVYWDGTHLRPKGNELAAAAIEKHCGQWLAP